MAPKAMHQIGQHATHTATNMTDMTTKTNLRKKSSSPLEVCANETSGFMNELERLLIIVTQFEYNRAEKSPAHMLFSTGSAFLEFLRIT